MSEITSEKLARFCIETGVLSTQESENALTAAGGLDASMDAFVSVLTRQELITNWQLDRLTKGHRDATAEGLRGRGQRELAGRTARLPRRDL